MIKQFNGKRITVVLHNYVDRSLKLFFDDNTVAHFMGCALVFDLGITGHTISYVSEGGTLGMTLIMKELKEDPDEYSFVILSRDIEDIVNKNELIVSYKELQISSTGA